MINKEFKYRGKNINLELAGKFAYTTYELEKRIANSAASAARSATQLKNTADKFVEVLNPEQLLALKAAASVVSRLAIDLQALRPWAKAYAQYMEEVRLRQREEELAARERERWPTDQAAVDEASDLIVFLDSGAAGDEVDAFIAAKRGYTNVDRGISHPGVRDALAELPAALQSRDLRTVRRKMLLILDRIGRSQPHGSEWFAGAEDFAEWRAARTRAHSVVASSLPHIRRTGGE